MESETLASGITDQVLASFPAIPDSRLKEVMRALIRHLHLFAKEVQLNEAEWAAGVDFLTRTGHISSGERQEFILLSDVLGLSMLVDEISNPVSGEVTASTVFGPFYSGKQSVLSAGATILKRDEPAGRLLNVCGTIGDSEGTPIEGALMEVWQTAPNGLYDVQDADQPSGHLRGSFLTDERGAYAFRTISPVSYRIPNDGPVGDLLGALGRHPWRPAHIHFMISAPGYRTLVTHLFVGDDPYLESDAVFGVKDSLVVHPSQQSGEDRLSYDFRLVRCPAQLREN